MSPIQGRAGALDASMDNPYIRAYRRVPVFGTKESVLSCLGSPTLRDYAVFLEATPDTKTTRDYITTFPFPV